MRNKILLAAISLSLSSPIAFADSDKFYLKINTSYSKLNNAEPEFSTGEELNTKYKSKAGYSFGVGAGYYLTDKVRADVIFDHFLGTSHRWDWSDGTGDFQHARLKGKIDVLTLNSYIDLFNLFNIKIFTGAGIGLSQTEAKLFNTGRLNNVNEEPELVKFKKSYNFSYSLHLGATVDFADELHIDVNYSWRDFGTTTRKEKGGSADFPYKGHHVTLGLRYDI